FFCLSISRSPTQTSSLSLHDALPISTIASVRIFSNYRSINRFARFIIISEEEVITLQSTLIAYGIMKIRWQIIRLIQCLQKNGDMSIITRKWKAEKFGPEASRLRITSRNRGYFGTA